MDGDWNQKGSKADYCVMPGRQGLTKGLGEGLKSYRWFSVTFQGRNAGFED